MCVGDSIDNMRDFERFDDAFYPMKLYDFEFISGFVDTCVRTSEYFFYIE
jgi:hypothetical protein